MVRNTTADGLAARITRRTVPKLAGFVAGMLIAVVCAIMPLVGLLPERVFSRAHDLIDDDHSQYPFDPSPRAVFAEFLAFPVIFALIFGAPFTVFIPPLMLTQYGAALFGGPGIIAGFVVGGYISYNVWTPVMETVENSPV